jgi:DMSO/TMAO reductase YedYZ heme-binding membrane subunit
LEQLDRRRGVLAAGSILLLATLVMAAPFLIIGSDLGAIFEGGEEALEATSRLAALLAVSLLFLDILTGSFRPLLRRIFRARPLWDAHLRIGLAALLLLLIHFATILPLWAEHWNQLSKTLILAGPVALGLLVLTISTALWRRHMPHSWRWLHLLNYLLFWIAIAHGIVIGLDGPTLALRLLFISFAVIALAGAAYRLHSGAWQRAMGMDRVEPERAEVT